MTPTEALNALDQAASLAPLPRRDHVAIQQAVEVLKQLIAAQKSVAE
jgi:hypothetical protein